VAQDLAHLYEAIEGQPMSRLAQIARDYCKDHPEVQGAGFLRLDLGQQLLQPVNGSTWRSFFGLGISICPVGSKAVSLCFFQAYRQAAFR
jgi:hypothetical protein